MIFSQLIISMFTFVSVALCASTILVCAQAAAQTTEELKEDPCRPFQPMKENFTATGKRINEIKCQEYTWNYQNRQQEAEQKKDCETKNTKEVTSLLKEDSDNYQGEFLYAAAIGWKADNDDQWKFFCGGSLISSKFVLTAAHCTREIGDQGYNHPKIVRLGFKKHIKEAVGAENPGVVDAKINRAVLHPNYKPPKKYFDIALLELENDVQFNMYIQPACLWNSDDLSSVQNPSVVTGWLSVEKEQTRRPQGLQSTAVELIDTTSCDKLTKIFRNRNWQGVSSDQFCAVVLAGGIGPCQGDSGAPVQTKIDLPLKRSAAMHYIIGMSSFGIKCGRSDIPEINTKISSFIDWIEDVVWPQTPSAKL